MAIEQTLLNHLVLEQLTTHPPENQATKENALPSEVINFIRQSIDTTEHSYDHLVLKNVSEINTMETDLWKREKRGLSSVTSLERLNDVRYINKYLEAINAQLRMGGYLVGCVETSQQRKERLLARSPWPINWLLYTLDFMVRRVWPKLPYLRKFYFQVTKGRNRVLSEMETFGRLLSCGFTLDNSLEVGGKLYFIAQKTAMPDFNTSATYSPLIHLNRVGKNGKMIKVYKMRTMSPYSEYLQDFVYRRCGLQEGGKLNNDPRITTAGRIMRKYWIDELPMLINLVNGDLKIFGVRPISKHYLSLYPEDFQNYRTKFKPGLIPPFYADLPKTLPEIVESERKYLQAYERQPLLTDFRYLGKAFYNIFIKRARSN